MTRSDQLDAIGLALSKFQRGLKPVPCNQTGSDGTPYADVTAIRQHVAKRLRDNGLSVIQFAGLRQCTTVVLHESGQFLSGSVDCGDDTYTPRYALMHALGVTQESAPRDGSPELCCAGALVPIPSRFTPDQSARVAQSFMDNNLSPAQCAVIAKSGKSADEMIAEAERLGGQK